jgi:hypothetical protein
MPTTFFAVHADPHPRDFGIEPDASEGPFGLMGFRAASVGQVMARAATEVFRPRREV